MSARLGNPVEVTQASVTLGAAAGRVIALNNSGWALLTSIALIYTATATGGNRVPVIDVKDSSGNLLWRGSQGGNITSAQVARIMAGAGLVTALLAAPILVNIALPDGFSVPANSTVTVFDNTNVDSADTVQGAIVFTL